MEINNFKLLEKLEIESRGQNKKIIKQDLNHSIKLFGLIGSLADLFLSKPLKILVSSFGNKKINFK
ncbi:MAG: hypothetical protein IPM42_10955 [Saprospiraceae bacterium]|nr:hypothetical protein [Saprospiraceae bacterium]